ncbi:hypothetical protein GCM10009104_02720 [Marinobacterium maritimum]|uniref:Methyltransferase domain-containing protein n=1 Tax=Marinobacterium maritimum TaxID=500162 RepID=A0ABP3T541_9GAMM
MAIPREKVKYLYDKGAESYDFATTLFRLAGLRMQTYRSEIVECLDLNPGDTVLELGCGTGLNFPLILEKVGPQGKIIGVDIAPGMLEVARQKARRNNWDNIELIESDLTLFNFPAGLDAIFSTGVFGYIPEYESVIEKAYIALPSGGRFAILDGKKPESLPGFVFKFVLAIGKQYGYTDEYFQVSPWKSVERLFSNTIFNTRYGGMIYEISGVKA